jgi:hypothetical protein
MKSFKSLKFFLIFFSSIYFTKLYRYCGLFQSPLKKSLIKPICGIFSSSFLISSPFFVSSSFFVCSSILISSPFFVSSSFFVCSSILISSISSDSKILIFILILNNS